MAKKKPESKIRTINLFCQFTAEERADKGELLADKRIRIDQLKEEAAKLNKEKGDLDKELLSISKQLKEGGENRFVKCGVIYDHPEEGMKTVRRFDTGEEWAESMSDDDMTLFRDADEEEAYKLKLLPEASIESLFGFDPGDAEHFIGKSVEDFAKRKIEISNVDLRQFGNHLFVKATFSEVRELTEISYVGKCHDDNGEVWYFFPPLQEPEGVETSEKEDDVEDAEFEETTEEQEVTGDAA